MTAALLKDVLPIGSTADASTVCRHLHKVAGRHDADFSDEQPDGLGAGEDKPLPKGTVIVSDETIRQWGLKFSQEFANTIRRRLPRPGDKWHMDEVVLKIAGKKHYLWRAVDQHGVVLDVLVQRRRDKKAAKRLLRKLLKQQSRPPRVMITEAV